mmetsp:Transcript_139278/g.445255  ORF Transcript_139278/g.445255 Transcript_139278/m.445255 type:complete len:1059 (-) Transcript_139278:66-3242(-)|eukprot:CAMPEP_0203890002 /NCGR_PEP_ID=MMETSP0359-20131031/33477_1 /ASSEMBLY_ACC=CAM_ASM_000338 /TAXON_ID=268821 /ORGANISM="Scrippsiella Hangoei, Strain SHTV-5" /LENGTH=1058 /DNA_ID=CAMNT_0050811537 /DNA_START=62 /DNA_END=3238 /DNA_ORIENTATION=-
MVAGVGGVWRVVGGGDKGGLLVRAEKQLSSAQEAERLATGAVVKALEHDDVQGRLHYELLAGGGPSRGWVSTQLQGRPLLEKVAGRHMPAPAAVQSKALVAPEAADVQRIRLWRSCVEKGGKSGARDVLEDEAKAPDDIVAAWHGHGQNGGGWSDRWGETWSGEESSAWWGAEQGPSQPRDSTEPWLLPEALPRVTQQGEPRRSLVKAVDTRKPLQKHLLEEQLFGKASEAPRRAAAAGAKAAAGKELTSSVVARKVMFGEKQQWAPPPQRPSADDKSGHRCFGHAGVADQLAPAEPFNMRRSQDAAGDDIDACDVQVCRACRLPLGQVGYAADDVADTFMHGECKAEALLQRVRDDEQTRLQREAAQNRERRAQYGIGWKVDFIPRNVELAAKLGFSLKAGQMCCVVLDSKSKSLSLAPTSDPAAAVNLEYLSLAIRVRRQEGREPLFSLDPVVNASEELKAGWQVKRFEPSWLAGTSLGEVMFQADYHLKELSMGACEQPVVGMKSCFDRAGQDEEWSAREWFVVRRAEVQLSQDSVLIPRVKMAVEAREQIQGDDGLEDAPITRPDHPLVKYAEDFSKYFDLISERRSVFHNLREVAKAAVLAKFLIEGEIRLDESWLHAGGQTVDPGCSEIPQLWAERCHSQIQVSDGRIRDWERGIGSRMHIVYGGVQMGLERFPLQEIVVAPSRISRSDMQQQRAPGFDLSRSLIQMLAAGMPSPQGVDLNLDTFNLSAPAEVALPRQQDFFAAGFAFWQLADHADFFADLYNPYLSDRRDEEDLFIPPDSGRGHLEKLRKLMGDERLVSDSRKQLFLSKAFSADSAGPVFPSSWTSSVEGQKAASGDAATDARQLLRAQGADEAVPSLDRVMRASAPSFDRRTEEGCRFRIYRVGGYEVRTTQPHGCKETTDVVFCRQAVKHVSEATSESSCLLDERIVKVLEYVEAVDALAGQCALRSAISHQFYIVAQTESGVTIVVEPTKEGALLWTESPSGLEARSLIAKVTRAAECRDLHISVTDIKQYHDEATCGQSGDGGRPEAWRRYARGLFELVAPARDESA